MLMRSNAQFTSGQLGPREVDPANRLTVRERIIETAEWTVCVPSIETLSVNTDRRTGQRLFYWTAGLVMALAGGANYVLTLVTPILPVLVAALAAAALAVLLGFRVRSRHELMVTSNEGNTFAIGSPNRAKLDEIHAFVAEKINRQDIHARRMFYLDGRDEDELGAHALGVDEALMAIAERADATSAQGAGPRAAVAPVRQDSIDYASVLPQVTEMHRFYERRADAGHIRERLSELELLMRSGTPAEQQQTRVRELALDLTNIMSSSPPVAELFIQVSRLVAR